MLINHTINEIHIRLRLPVFRRRLYVRLFPLSLFLSYLKYTRTHLQNQNTMLTSQVNRIMIISHLELVLKHLISAPLFR